MLRLVTLSAASLWAFVAIADAIRDPATQAMDRRILLAMRERGDTADPIGPVWLEEVARDLTALGGFPVLALVTVGASAYFVVVKRKRELSLLLTTVVTGGLLAGLLKLAFQRPPPELVPGDMAAYATSFPSGHAMMATITYLTLAGLLAQLHSDARMKLVFIGGAVLVSVLVGVTRVYLGVHWPTDVLAGWTVGAGWALACCLAAIELERRTQQ